VRKLFAVTGIFTMALGAAVANAQTADDDRGNIGKKGAVLVLPKIELRYDAAQVLEQDTFISLSNDGDQAISVHIFYVNGDETSVPGECWKFNNDTLDLTRNQPAYWSADSGAPGPSGAALQTFRVVDNLGFGRDIDGAGPSTDTRLRGFCVMWATNSSEEPVCWNQLSAKVTIVDYENSDVAEYEAYAFQCLDAENPIDLYGTDDEIELNGTAGGYDIAPGQLLLDFFSDSHAGNPNGAFGHGTTINTELTLMLLDMDFIDGGELPATFVIFTTHNENEQRRSFPGQCLICWRSDNLFAWSISLGRQIQGTDRAKARILGSSNGSNNPALPAVLCPVPCTGDPPDTEEASRRALLGVSTIKVAFPGPPPASATAITALVGMSDENGDNIEATIRFGPVQSGGNIQNVLPLNDE